MTVSPPRGAVGHAPIWKPVPSRQPDEREPLFHSEAYAIGKKEKPPFLPEEPSSSSEEDDPIPDELLCLICKDIMTDAVVIPCCGNSYCDECKARPGPRGGGVPPGTVGGAGVTVWLPQSVTAESPCRSAGRACTPGPAPGRVPRDSGSWRGRVEEPRPPRPAVPGSALATDGP